MYLGATAAIEGCLPFIPLTGLLVKIASEPQTQTGTLDGLVPSAMDSQSQPSDVGELMSSALTRRAVLRCHRATVAFILLMWDSIESIS